MAVSLGTLVLDLPTRFRDRPCSLKMTVLARRTSRRFVQRSMGSEYASLGMALGGEGPAEEDQGRGPGTEVRRQAGACTAEAIAGAHTSAQAKASVQVTTKTGQGQDGSVRAYLPKALQYQRRQKPRPGWLCGSRKGAGGA